MAESNATQVILTDDGLKIIKAQSTADSAAGGVTNLNDPNLMSVIEKQNNIGQFAGLTSQYNVIIQDAKDDGIDTTAVTTAYNNLNEFMAGILADPSHASDIDRVTYKKYQDAYNEELAKIQSAFQNNANNKFTSAANATSQAASTASQAFSAADSAFSQAQAIGSQVDSSMAVQSTATAKAKSTADSAFSQAKTAIDTGQAASQAVTALKDGSTLTIAQLGSGLAEKVSNSEYASYKNQTASQIGELVTDGAFSAYSQATARLISATVATSDFDSYKDQTAKDISSKVESSAFESYKKQTDEAIEDKVSSADYTSDKKQTAEMIQTLVSKSPSNIIKDGGFNSAIVGQVPSGWDFSNVGQIATNSDNASGLVATGRSVLQINSQISSNSDTFYGDWFDVQTGDQFYTEFKARWSNMSQKGTILIGLETCDANSGNLQWLSGASTSSPNTWTKYTGIATVGANATRARIWVSWQGSSAANEAVFVTDLVVRPTYSTQSDINQLSHDINLRVTKDDLIDQINIQAGKTLISSSGQLTLAADTIYFDTNSPVIIPSANIGSLLVGKTLTAANISANTFSTNNETFTVDSNGAITAKNMTLIGGTLTSPTINTSTINGSTINGTTFHGGDIISHYNNTAGYYPMTITPDGTYKSTYFDNAVGLQSSVESGAIAYKYRSMIGNGQYLAYDSVINGQGLDLQSGYTSAKDTTFSNPVSTTTGYVIVNANDGITLHGDNQQITFNGTSADTTPKGVIITPYGNINPNGTQNIWYVGNNMSMKTASFGMDGSGTYNIQFNRSLDIGNFNINTYHTITSSDNGPIHFNRANGNPVDIYASTVNYDSLVKSSLLSVKRDVRKADTAYWAQLVNSIDLATYQYKSDDNTSHLRLSSIVDDVNKTKQWQLPDVFISRDEDGKLCGVDDSVLLNATLATVQEQQKEIDQLNGHLLELEAKLNG
ncbi:phage tail protein [Lactiplantibacillus plantarum]|uniref:phage tail protein n=1 Tax=Lactiplantibacillus plantarum TaxID=1590 RepID=UPI000FEEC58E|nr:phage tail protein [Lactiplantibacillus plantarum]QBA77620.1 phage tail protein [Lactiplantibacillus plantarum]RWZ70936.1 phage tail protein [Lactiplantibacillus plantarum]